MRLSNPFVRQVIWLMQQVNDRVGPWLFYAALVLMFASSGWFWIKADVPPIIMDFGGVFSPQSIRVLCGIRLLLMASRHPRYVGGCAIALSILAVSFKMCGDKLPFMTALLLCTSRDADFRRIVRICLWSMVFITVIAFALYSAGCAGDLVKHRFGQVGHSYGMDNPNSLCLVLGMITLQALYLAKVREVRMVGCVSVAMAAVGYGLTLGLTMTVALLALPLLYVAVRRVVLPRWCCYVLPWIGLMLSLVLMAYFGPSLGATTFESRFSMAAMVFERMGVSLLGQDYGPVYPLEAMTLGVEPFNLDNLYLVLLLYYGLVPTAIVLTMTGFALSRLVSAGETLLVAMLLTLLLVGMMEAVLLRATMCFMLYYPFARWTDRRSSFTGRTAGFLSLTACPNQLSPSAQKLGFWGQSLTNHISRQ